MKDKETFSKEYLDACGTGETRVEKGEFFQRHPTAEFIILAQAAEIVNDPERLKEVLKDAVAVRESLQRRTDRVQKDIDAVKSLNRRTRVRSKSK